MRRRFLLAFVFVLLSAAGLSAQQLLPEHFGDWHVQSCAEKPARPILWEEAGEREFRFCQFSSAGLSATIWAGRYRDPSSAYELYTSLLKPTMQPSVLGKYTAVDGDGLLALVGDVVVEVLQPGNISTQDLRQLVTIVGARSDQAPLPPVRTYLPERGLVNGTQRYALGPVAFRAAANSLDRTAFAALADLVGFSSGAEAMFARYKAGKQEAVLLLIDYPTPQLAELHLKHLEGAVLMAQRAGSSLEQMERAGTAVERKGSLLSIVLAPTSAAYAEKLRGAVNYETQVTWSEPSATATDPPITSTLVKIIIGTGVFMGLAVVLGVAFGGVRVLTKIFLPGKVFDRPEQMDILQLGLSGKPIDSRDFYGSSH
jgi:uncharacterized protein DUF6599